MSKKLVKADTESYERYFGSGEAAKDGALVGIFKSLFKHDRDLFRKQTYSTFKYSDGALAYAQSESEHNLYNKVPDMEFVGLGTWVYEDSKLLTDK